VPFLLKAGICYAVRAIRPFFAPDESSAPYTQALNVLFDFFKGVLFRRAGRLINAPAM
jgi:hypothetical protein